MIAEPLALTQDDDVIDLEKLSVDELEAERVTVRTEIDNINVQLQDASRVRLYASEDEYLTWRRRALTARKHLAWELDDIKAALAARRRGDQQAKVANDRAARERRHAENLAMLQRHAEAHEARTEAMLRREAEFAARRASLIEQVAAGGGADTLLLRMTRVQELLMKDIDSDTLSPELRQTMRDASLYLKAMYGERFVLNYRQGRIDIDGAPVAAGES